MSPTTRAHLSALVTFLVSAGGQLVALGLLAGTSLRVVQVALAVLTAVSASYLGATFPTARTSPGTAENNAEGGYVDLAVLCILAAFLILVFAAIVATAALMLSLGAGLLLALRDRLRIRRARRAVERESSVETTVSRPGYLEHVATGDGIFASRHI